MESEFRSPLPKKGKKNEDTTSCSQYDQLQEKLFQNALFEKKLEENVESIIDKYYSAQRDSILSKIENVNIELPNLEFSNFDNILKDLSAAVEKLKDGSKIHKQHIKQDCDNSQILAILEAKRNCPISKIIDNL